MQIENIQITITPYGANQINYQLYDLCEQKILDRGICPTYQEAALEAIGKAEKIVQEPD